MESYMSSWASRAVRLPARIYNIQWVPDGVRIKAFLHQLKFDLFECGGEIRVVLEEKRQKKSQSTDDRLG